MDYFVETKTATGLITTNIQNIIIETPPIWKRYKGKTMIEFVKDQNKYGKVKCQLLNRREI